MLPEKNITTSMVANEIGENKYDLSSLCKSSRINMFAKCKPVKGPFPFGNNNKYSINIPSFHTENNDNWTYIKPTAEFRLGDFRAYNKNALPPIYLLPRQVITDTNVIEGKTKAIKVSFNDKEISRQQLGLNLYYCAAQLVAPSGQILYVTSDKNIGNYGNLILFDFSRYPLRQSAYQGRVTINIFMSEIKQTIPASSLSGVKLSMPKGSVASTIFINKFQMNITSEALCTINVTEVNRSLSSSGWESINRFGKGTDYFKTKDSLAIKIVVKSTINRTIQGLKFYLSPTFFNDKLDYDVSNILYSSSLQKVSQISATPAGNTYIVFIQNCMNRQNGSSNFNVPDGLKEMVNISFEQYDMLVENTAMNISSTLY